ncbi:MAG TPA: hypothetical protein VF267_07080, partial [Gammaproteobacteria bacterium]
MEILLRNLARLVLLAFLTFGLAACGGPDGPPGNIGDGGDGGDDGDDGDGGDGGNNDRTPDGFTFTDIDNAVPGFAIASNGIRVEGLDQGVSLDAVVSAGKMSINGSPVAGTTAKVTNGDQVIVTLDAPTVAGETVKTSLSIGDATDEFAVTAAGPGFAMANADGRLRVSWNAMHGAANFHVSGDRSGADGFTVIGSAAGDATSYEAAISPHRYAWGDARFALEACNGDGECVLVAQLTSTQLDSVGTVTYAKSDKPEPFNAFGASVALDGAGLTAAVGEPFKVIDNADDGMVHIFSRELSLDGKGPWSKQATLQLPKERLGDFAQFGYSVALSDDGNTLVVGAPFSSNGSASGNGVGSVCVFKRTDQAWDAGTCVNNPQTDNDLFGHAVAINETGDRIVVGAPLEDSGDAGNSDDNSVSTSGAAWVFDEIGGTWAAVAYLKQNVTAADSEFGFSVAVSGRGPGNGFMLVGAPGENLNQGAAHYFKEGPAGIAYDKTFVSDNPNDNDDFGASVAMATGGADVLVGAPGDDSALDGDSSDNNISRSGAIYVIDTAAGTPSQFLKASNIAEFMQFGSKLAISRDGKAAIVGLENDFSNAAGVSGDDTDASFTDSAGGMYY